MRFTIFDPANTPALKNARVNGLFTDDLGTLWINIMDGSMISFRQGGFPREWRGAQVADVFTRSNRVYFASIASGITTRIEAPGFSNQWQTFYYDQKRIPARLFCQDTSGVIWCLLRDGQIKRIIGPNIFDLPVNAGPTGQTANYLTADPNGQVWVKPDHGILRWNGERFENQTRSLKHFPMAVALIDGKPY